MPRKGVRQPYTLVTHHELLPDFGAPGCFGQALICELKWGSQTLMIRRFHTEWRIGRPEGRDIKYQGHTYKWVEQTPDAAMLLRAEFRSLVFDLERLIARSN